MWAGSTLHWFSCILLGMTDRRSGPPLFDLMRERGEGPRAPAAGSESTPRPVPRPASKPTSAPSPSRPATPPVEDGDAGPAVPTKQTAWDSSGGVSRAERSAAAMLDGEVVDDSGIRLSSPMFYTLIAVGFALILAAWTIGYQRGNAAGKKAIEPYVRDQPVVRPTETTASSPRVNRPGGGADQPNAMTTPTTTPTATSPATSTTIPTGTARGLAVMSPSGFIDTDPREPGLNYLVLATLNTEQAADAISFLYLHSVPVIGVPVVDNRSSGANNPSRYRLYSLGVAIPGNQWSAMSVERSQHQKLIADLGARWQRERRGGSDFSQTNWEKYEP